MPNLYEVKGVHYGYGSVPVLNGVDLTIAPQSFNCLVGPSGSGKTTLLNLLGLLDAPQKGTLTLDETDTSSWGESRIEDLRLRKIGFVFQAFHLIPTLSILENTIYFLGSLGWSRKDSTTRGEEVLDMVGLSDQRHRRPAQLSSGQCQRVSIARALAKKPEIILADEPTASLDRKTAESVIAIFQELQRKEKVTCIFATHDLNLVSYAERVFLLRDGKLSEEMPR